MTARNAIIFVTCSALTGAAAIGTASAQTLASRVSNAPRNATIIFSYPTKQGVCGNGRTIVTQRGDGDDISVMQVESNGSTNSFHTSSRKSREDWLRDCEPGPAHVRLERTGTTVSALRVTVGGTAGDAQDLGTVTGDAAAGFLLDFATAAPRKIGQKAIFAASLADPDATVTTGLIAITRKSGLANEIRKDAVFWLSQTEDPRSTARLREILADEREDVEVRESSVFALAQNDSPETIQLLFNTARNAGSAQLKKSAIFWLGNKAGAKATAGLTSMIEDDSQEMEVRDAAVFAISNQKTEEAVTILINIAKNSKEPHLRKQAMFWLGQKSSDPRVLKLFEDILIRN
jgi:hypothetical protein